MRRLSIMAFDDFIPSTTAVTTAADLNATLGQYDTLAWHILIDNITGTGTFTVTIMHSGDGRVFHAKSNHGTGTGHALAVDSSTTIGAAGFYSDVGSDKNTYAFGSSNVPLPSLPYVQLKLQLTGVTSAHVRLWVTARDRGFAQKRIKLNLGKRA